MTDESVFSDRSTGSVSTSLLIRAIGGDEAAFAMIMELYGGLVYSWCRRKGVHSNDSADIAQQVFMAVSRNVRTFRRDEAGQSFRAWLRTITRSKIVDYWKQRTVDLIDGSEGAARIQEIAAPDLQDDDDTVEAEVQLLFQNAVRLIEHEFSERDFQVLWRVAVDGRAVDDVANEFQTPRGNVYTIVSRIKRRVQLEFGDVIEHADRGEPT